MKKDIIQIKPEHEKELRKLRILTKFKKNLNNGWLRNCPSEKNKKYLLHQLQNINLPFHGLIKQGFIWYNTPEGYGFWCNIYSKYKKLDI